eukprot:scaffold54512_cov60-Attheya_sp.AAC.2
MRQSALTLIVLDSFSIRISLSVFASATQKSIGYATVKASDTITTASALHLTCRLSDRGSFRTSAGTIVYRLATKVHDTAIQ